MFMKFGEILNFREESPFNFYSCYLNVVETPQVKVEDNSKIQ